MANGTVQPRLHPIADLNPPASSRAWLSAPHPNLPIVATCASDKTIRIYSLSNFTQVSSISGGHKRSVRSCAWKPNLKGESSLATASFDSSVGIWRRDDTAHDAKETDFTTGGQGDNAEEEEDEEWRFALVLDGHDSEVKGVSWSAGGNFLATCSRDKSVWIWEEVGDDDFETIAVLQEHTADVKCVAWHPEEEMLASGSYDNDIRLWKEDADDWTCIGVLSDHSNTVWSLAWEGLESYKHIDSFTSPDHTAWLQRRQQSGPRLASCSDDLHIKIWRRNPREKQKQNPLSIIRSGSIEEEWVIEAELPQRHDRTIYAISWSASTGMIVSAGSDGQIIVYREKWQEDTLMTNNDTDGGPSTSVDEDASKDIAGTTWHVVGEITGAHGPFEINHVAWAKRADRGKTSDQEEVIISTGDDGSVKVWSFSAISESP
ncbi:MAG: hypothetical protein GOMPHAMPRED_006323 [Gomphillus americanus]|uniref:Probable cytosolic iron-sulfur protein assembly protein 1 n=1 Tax=Gomphillus americanus TaxID=1940652 RepID=A0A8H3EMT8_9LECA|nr:MAG: hypothetical protein GOMPHAMPRED_006323 [Gomphillus americanus]